MIFGRRVPPRQTGQAILLIYLCTFLGALAFYQPINVLYLGSRGLSLAQVLLLESFLLVFMLLTELPSGYLSDRLGCKWVIIAGFAFAAAAQVVYACAGSFSGFAVSSSLYGVSIACLSGSRDTYLIGHLDRLGLTDDRHTGDVYGKITALGLYAGVLSSLVGAQLARASLALPAVATAIAACVALLITLFLPRPPVPAHPNASGGSPSWPTALRTVLRSKTLLYFALTPTFALFASVNSIAQVKLTGFGVPVAWLGVLFAAATLLAAFASQQSGRMAQWWGTSNVHLLAVAGGGFAYLGAVLPGPVAIIASTICAAVFMNIRSPVSAVIMNTQMAPALRASMFSICGLISGCVGALINPAIGYLAERSGDLALAAVGCTLLCLAGVWYGVSRHTAQQRPGVVLRDSREGR
ncbi:MFS transporter [Actinoplanes sp. CA-054009]